MRKLQLFDWLDDLGEFPASTVTAAVQEWRRTQSRRPTPSDIRKICVDAEGNRQEQLALPKYGPSDLDAEARLKAERFRRWDDAETSREQWARECGCRDFAHAMKIGIAIVAARNAPKAPAQPTTMHTPFVLPAEDDPAVQQTLRDLEQRSGP